MGFSRVSVGFSRVNADFRRLVRGSRGLVQGSRGLVQGFREPPRGSECRVKVSVRFRFSKVGVGDFFRTGYDNRMPSYLAKEGEGKDPTRLES